MEKVWFTAALWLLLALIAVLAAHWTGISAALSEIVDGTVAQLVIGMIPGREAIGAKAGWITFLAGTGAVVLTFLAGAELDPDVFRAKWKEALGVGRAGFFAPFLGATFLARFLRGWGWMPAWLAGVALSTTSVAVVHAVMLEPGFNRTEYGKAILAACLVNDLGTVLALGFLLAPFTRRTLVFAALCALVLFALPFLTRWFFDRYGRRVSEMETKYPLFPLFGTGGVAAWAGSEAVLPAYLIGMMLAGTVGRDHFLVRRLRTLTSGLLTPFYFIRAGSFVSVAAPLGAPLVSFALFGAKMVSKLAGLLPVVRAFGYGRKEGTYDSLMMSTGLTSGTLSALFGLNHGLIDQGQYSHLVAAVIGSAVIPTAIANARYLPAHLLPEEERRLRLSACGEPEGELDE